MKDFMVQAWGGGQEHFAEDYPDHKKHNGSLYFYFDTEAEMNNLINAARKYSKGCVVTSVGEGDIHNRIVACMDLVFEGKPYYYEQDFGYGFTEHGAEYMFFDGNYSCDCNKKLFLARSYEELSYLEGMEHNCTDDIAIENFRIEYRP